MLPLNRLITFSFLLLSFLQNLRCIRFVQFLIKALGDESDRFVTPLRHTRSRLGQAWARQMTDASVRRKPLPVLAESAWTAVRVLQRPGPAAATALRWVLVWLAICRTWKGRKKLYSEISKAGAKVMPFVPATSFDGSQSELLWKYNMLRETVANIAVGNSDWIFLDAEDATCCGPKFRLEGSSGTEGIV